MASIYYLNNPSNPLWDYISTALEDHPFFAPRGHHPHQHPHPHSRHHAHHHGGPFWGWGAYPQTEATRGPEVNQSSGQTSESTPGPSTESEKPHAEKEAASPESDTDTFHHGPCDKGKDKAYDEGCSRGHGKRHGGRGRHGPGHNHRGFHGPPPFGPFGFQGHPFWAAGRGRGPHTRGGRGGRGKRAHCGPAGFDSDSLVPGFDFLRGLAEQFGIPLNDQRPENADFVPPADVFDTPTQYVVHVSLSGAKKNDLSIDYDADESVLRLAGVVYRPGMTEDLHEALVMEERTREVGVFEREVRLGTREAPAVVSVDDISARLEEGVLVVTLPKVIRQPEPKKKVVVEDGNSFNEKSPAYTSRSPSVTMTPTESEDESEVEGETKDYVKIPVQ